MRVLRAGDAVWGLQRDTSGLSVKARSVFSEGIFFFPLVFFSPRSNI